jgi:oligopeptide transport system permease protein
VTTFILKRFLSLIPTLFLVATLVFFLTRAAPGGPFDQDRQLPPEVAAAVSAKYKLDDPIGKQ